MKIIHRRGTEFTEIGLFLDQDFLLCVLSASAVSVLLN